MAKNAIAKKSVDTSAPPFAIPDWPADKIERRNIGLLKKNPRNAKLHPPEQIEMVRASIREFGWTMPILVDEKDLIIAGHARFDAASLEGIEEVPVIVARGWSKLKKKAYMEADNRLTELGDYDDELRRALLTELSDEGFPMQAVGWMPDVLGEYLAAGNAGETDPEIAPEPPKRPVVRRSDLWVLGNHRILCGDSTKPEDVERLVEKCSPNLMVSDPPYGVDYDPNWRNEANRWKGSNVKLGAAALGKVRNDKRADWEEAWALFKGDVVYIWHAALRGMEAASSLMKAGFDIRSQIIWDKERLVIGRGNYHWQHEPCWYGVRRGKNGHWQGDRTQSTVWTIPKPQTSETGHGTQKPIDCMKRPIENNSRPGEFVYDPFVGSGTTIIAAEMTGRRCIAMEIEPGYVEVCIERWQTFTGLEATLDGVVFADVARARRKGRKERADETSADRKPIRGRKRAARPDRALAKSPIRAEVPSA